MHEVGIAASVIDVVRAEVAMRPGWKACAVTLRIGVLAGVDPESLRFGFDALTGDTELAALRLDVESAAGDELDVVSIELEGP
jgi:Zn finger protein HypA/HybF involved in hydrogenase expression